MKEVNYIDLKGNIKFKRKSKVEIPILELKSNIEKLKVEVIFAKTKYSVPGEGSGGRREITNWMKNPPKNGKLYKESKVKTYH